MDNNDFNSDKKNQYNEGISAIFLIIFMGLFPPLWLVFLIVMIVKTFSNEKNKNIGCHDNCKNIKK